MHTPSDTDARAGRIFNEEKEPRSHVRPRTRSADQDSLAAPHEWFAHSPTRSVLRPRRALSAASEYYLEIQLFLDFIKFRKSDAMPFRCSERFISNSAHTIPTKAGSPGWTWSFVLASRTNGSTPGSELRACWPSRLMSNGSHPGCSTASACRARTVSLGESPSSGDSCGRSGIPTIRMTWQRGDPDAEEKSRCAAKGGGGRIRIHLVEDRPAGE